MSIPSWPATLPQTFERSGYNQAFQDTALRSSMEVGPAKVRRRTSMAVKPLTAPMIFTRTQFAALETFYDDTLLGGTLRFTFTHPLTATSIEVRFTERPVGTVSGMDMRVELKLEILP